MNNWISRQTWGRTPEVVLTERRNSEHWLVQLIHRANQEELRREQQHQHSHHP